MNPPMVSTHPPASYQAELARLEETRLVRDLTRQRHLIAQSIRDALRAGDIRDLTGFLEASRWFPS